MNTRIHPPKSLLWVAVSLPGHPRYWARITRLLDGASPDEKERTIQQLKAGRIVDFETSGLSIQYLPMSRPDRSRLEHLLTVEGGGFRLAAFRHNIALFYRGHQDYCSMNEMAERGFSPAPAIALNPRNVPLTSLHGWLLDVFVPVGNIALNFHPSSGQPT